MITKQLIVPTLAGAALLLGLPFQPAFAVNWDSVKPYGMTLFYPGQASWEWILTDHSGQKSVRKGSPCLECHETEETDMGKKMVTGKKLEPTPIAGKPESVSMQIKFANDGKNLYTHLEWKDTGFHSGQKQDDKFPVKIALMIADKNVKEAMVSGCWGSCHDDSSHMASAEKDSTRSLYLAASRNKMSRQGGGDDIKSADELTKLVDSGSYLEFWQAKLTPDQAPVVTDGYILEKRNKSATPRISADATLKDGVWRVTLTRPLQGSGAGQHNFVSGETYYFGVALHDDYTSGRFHYISFGHSLAIDGGKGELVAAKQ
jgi:cytochrome c-type protein NapC